MILVGFVSYIQYNKSIHFSRTHTDELWVVRRCCPLCLSLSLSVLPASRCIRSVGLCLSVRTPFRRNIPGIDRNRFRIPVRFPNRPIALALVLEEIRGTTKNNDHHHQSPQRSLNNNIAVYSSTVVWNNINDSTPVISEYIYIYMNHNHEYLSDSYTNAK